MLSQPSLLSPRGRVVVDSHYVVDLAVEIRGRSLACRIVSRTPSLEVSFVLKFSGIVEDLAVAVAQDVGGVPAAQSQHPCLQAWRDQVFMSV